MEKTIKIFSSHEEAQEAEYVYWASLSPAERLGIGFELYFRSHPETREKHGLIAKVVNFRELKE